MSKIITTSWDDGHPKDFLISELLDKYNLKGTFYIPKENPEHQLMTGEQVYSLSKNNEIGGHTLHHIRLTNQAPEIVKSEVEGCYAWLQNILKEDPVSFCFPRGAYNDDIVACVQRAGFKIARTTRLLSVNESITGNLIPTTIQVYEHSRTTYLKHLIKRLNFRSLFLWMRSADEADILKLTDYYINYIIDHDGCFHLWGHSWEIEEFELWKKLELIFQHISNIPGFKYVPNKELVAR
jgi:peptidoglycan/xylan/chitin deacetylase (PgdA/CDA1 family)